MPYPQWANCHLPFGIFSVTKSPRINPPGPVSVLPRRDKTGYARIEFLPMTAAHATWWHQNVQSIINTKYRALSDSTPKNAHKKVRTDIDWDWELWHWLLSVHNFGHASAIKSPAMGLTLAAINEEGFAVPIGMMTLVPRYLCNSDKIGEKTYLWFLASAPSTTYDDWLDGKALDGVGSALIDAAIQESYKVKADGAVLLHADPDGGQYLLDTYKGLGFTSLGSSFGPITLFRWRNRSQYMLLGAKEARKIIRDNEVYRNRT
ncbi:hypothetical protein [Pseudomonas mandelii]|uniref:hypothetical protein n=1 Tax=Pseudomonas mandelii TaxID=75612 RepID=UPI00224B0362|nr:hypothetical protein [Pseudomonas mandelii]MCX2901080.1 hypothetical protein [Pseudomonas mandelii]